MFEKNIPMPDYQRGRLAKGSSKYNFDKMNVGDSFFVETDDINHPMLNSVRVFAYRNGIRVTTRKQDSGYRVWRVK